MEFSEVESQETKSQERNPIITMTLLYVGMTLFMMFCLVVFLIIHQIRRATEENI